MPPWKQFSLWYISSGDIYYLTAVIRDRKGKPSVAALPTNLLVGTLHNLQLFSQQALELAVKLIASGWELQSSLVEANSQRLSSFVVG